MWSLASSPENLLGRQNLMFHTGSISVNLYLGLSQDPLAICPHVWGFPQCLHLCTYPKTTENVTTTTSNTAQKGRRYGQVMELSVEWLLFGWLSNHLLSPVSELVSSQGSCWSLSLWFWTWCFPRTLTLGCLCSLCNGCIPAIKGFWLGLNEEHDDSSNDKL